MLRRIALSLAFIAALLPATVWASSHRAHVTVVHGVPDLLVDVYVGDQKVLSNFAFGTVTDPLALDPGTYRLAVRPAGSDPASPPVLSAEATLRGGDNVTVVAHLTADGQPTLSLFANDVSQIPAGQGRVIVRHTAQAPAVDVRAGGNVLFGNLANPNEAKGEVPSGTYQVDLVPAGQSTVVFGPVDLTVQAGVATIVYAIGSLEGGSFRLAVQQITGLGPTPGAIGTGLGSTAAATDASAAGWFLLAALAALVSVATPGLVRRLRAVVVHSR